MTEAKSSLRQRVYYAAREGMAITLYALLTEQQDINYKEYLEYWTEEDGQKCTPLIIASKNGHENVVKMLMTKFQPSLEQEGTVQFDGFLIEGATPLWCAAGAGHLSVVKTLISYKADVNRATKSNSTPLRAACFDGRLDIVRYLVENNADIHIANRYNNTCLMIAAYKGHLDVVTYLIEKCANLDTKAHCGATALHFAAEHGHIEIFQKLIESGGGIIKNEIGMCPLITAADRTRAEIVEYCIAQPWCSRCDKITALELLGASYANDKDNYNLEKSFFYLEMSMKERFSEGIDVISKSLNLPISAYENRLECQNMEELQAIKHNTNALHMESLAIRERILGSSNPELPHPIIFRGAVFADNARFDRCIQLWQHALNLRHNNNVTVRKDLLRFAQVFSQMIHIGVDLPFEYVEDVFKISIEVIQRNKHNLDNCASGVKDGLQDELEDNIHTVLYMMVIITKLIKKATKEQEHNVNRFVYNLNRMNILTRNGSSLLHLALNAETPVDNFHTKNICKFPCVSTGKLLIQCGADVNQTDYNRNTPLHVIVGYQKPITDFLTLHAIITTLIEAGAHIDTVNNNGETPFDAATNGVAEIILRTQSKLSLKCLAAKAVKKFNLDYLGSVPYSLVGFIEMHGVSNKVELGAD